MSQIPTTIRSRITLADGLEAQIREVIAKKLDHVASLVAHATVRFDDVNGPKGGVAISCNIAIALRGRPSVRVETRAVEAEAAFGSAVATVIRSLARERNKYGLRGNPRSPASVPASTKAKPDGIDDAGEIIGRRVGHGPDALERALARPEKQKRDAYVDTSRPGVSASDRRAGATMTARRNTRGKTTRATAMLEDSRTVPSRKSTRRGANRAKPSQGKERAALAKALTPSARAAGGRTSRR